MGFFDGYDEYKRKQKEVEKQTSKKNQEIAKQQDMRSKQQTSNFIDSLNPKLTPQIKKPSFDGRLSSIVKNNAEWDKKPVSQRERVTLQNPLSDAIAPIFNKENHKKATIATLTPVAKVLDYAGNVVRSGISLKSTPERQKDVTNAILGKKTFQLPETGMPVVDFAANVLSDPLTYTPAGITKRLLASGASKLLPKIAPKLALKGEQYLAKEAASKMLDPELIGQLGKKYGMSDIRKVSEHALNNADELVSKQNMIESIFNKSKSNIANTGRSFPELPLVKGADKVINPLTEIKPNDGAGMQKTTWKKLTRPSADTEVSPLANVRDDGSSISSTNNIITQIETKIPQTVEELSDNVDVLQKTITAMEEQQKKGIKINLQLFAEAQAKLQRLSRTYTNTFEKSDMFTQAEKDMLNSKFTDDANNTVKSEIESLNNAKNRLANNYDAEVRALKDKELYSGEDVDTVMGILEKEKLKARQTGDYTKVRQIARDNVKKAGLEGGRTVQAFAKYSRTTEGKIVEAQRAVDNFEDAVKKQNPQIAKDIDKTSKQVKDLQKSIKNETEKAIDEAVKSINNSKPKRVSLSKIKPNDKEVKATNFPAMLQAKISKALNPKTPEDKGFIRNMIDDLFSEAKENINLPKTSKLDRSMGKLSNAYKFRNYAGEIRTKAHTLLKEEFADEPQVLELLDNYFNKGFKPPHSQKLLNGILSKRLGGLNVAAEKVGTATNRPNLSQWAKDWYSTGRASREDFVNSIVKETGLSGDEAKSLKNLIDSKLHVATKQMKDKLLETVMKPTKPGVIKKGTAKLTELTNIGLLENNKFTSRISEKISPVIKQLMREHNIDLTAIVKSSIQDKQNAKEILLRDVFKNVAVDDQELVKLMELVNKEFASLAKNKQEQILSNLLKPKVAATPKTMVEKLREKINLGVYGDDVDTAIQDAIKAKYNLPTLSNDEVKFITETMDSVKGLDQRGEKYLEAMAKVEKLILEKVPASLSDKMGSGAFISMLGNFTSPLINVTGNTLLAIPEIASNPLRRLFDKGISKGLKTGFRTAGATNLGALAKGVKQGARSVKRDFLGGRDFKDLKGKSIKEISDIIANPINTDTSMTNFGDKFEVGNRLAFDNKVGRTLENIVGTNMKIGDIPFNKAYFEDTLAQLMKANKVSEPTEDMVKTAFQVSQERTFKDKNIISESAVALKNLPKLIQQRAGFKPEAQKGLKGVAAELPQILFNSQVPFAKTPANLVKRGLEYSPLGLIEGGAKLIADKGNMTMMKQREIVDRFTRGTVGTAMLGGGALAYNSGLVTDARDKNRNTENLKQQNGVLPDALNAFGKTIDLKRLQPFTTPLIAGSRLAQGKGNDAFTSIMDSIEGAINQYSDMPMLQSLAKVTQLLSSSDSGIPVSKGKILLDVATTLPKQYTPSILKKLTYALDPFERDLGSDNAVQYALNGIVGKLPGVSQTFPARADVYGDPIKTYDGDNNLANTMLNPYLSKTKKENPTSNEALRLNRSNIDGDLKNSVIPKEVSKDLGSVKLTIDQQNQYQKLMGDKVQIKIKSLLNDPKYVALGDNDKAIAFSRALDLSREEAKTQMLKNLGVDVKKNKKIQNEKTASKDKLYRALNLKKAAN